MAGEVTLKKYPYSGTTQRTDDSTPAARTSLDVIVLNADGEQYSFGRQPTQYTRTHNDVPLLTDRGKCKGQFTIKGKHVTTATGHCVVKHLDLEYAIRKWWNASSNNTPRLIQFTVGTSGETDYITDPTTSSAYLVSVVKYTADRAAGSTNDMSYTITFLVGAVRTS